LRKWLAARDRGTLRTGGLAWAARWLGQFSHNVDGADESKFGNLRGVLPEGETISTEVQFMRSRWYAASQQVASLLAKNERLAGAVFSTFVEQREAFDPRADRSVPDAMAAEILALRLEGKK